MKAKLDKSFPNISFKGFLIDNEGLGFECNKTFTLVFLDNKFACITDK